MERVISEDKKMSWWRKFLKLRKQNDSVKIMLIFTVAAIGFFAASIRNAVLFYADIHQPVEYVLTAGGQRPLEGYIHEIQKLDSAECVSLQKETSVSFYIEGENMDLNCIGLSSDYLSKVYDLHEPGSMRTFYINARAVEQLPEKVRNRETEQIQADYRMNGEENEEGTARIIVLDDDGADEQPQVLYKDDYLNLSEAALSIRVCMQRNDLNGSTVDNFIRMGLNVENKEELKLSSVERGRKLERLKYELLISVLCMFFTACLIKYGKKPVLRESVAVKRGDMGETKKN